MVKFFLFQGAKIAYTVEGKGKAIVFLHGFLGKHSVWKDVIEPLKNSHKVICVDLPGHGQSDSIAYVHSMDLMAQLINALLKELNLRKVILVGHSMGGYVSLAFAELYPEKITHLVLVNSSAKADNAQRLNSRNQLLGMIKRDKDGAVSKLVPSFFENTPSLFKKKRISRYRKIALSCSQRGIIANIEGMKIRPEREIILKFAPYPYLIVIGRKDSILDEKALLKEASLGVKGESLILEDCSHMSLLEEPGRIGMAIKRFALKS